MIKLNELQGYTARWYGEDGDLTIGGIDEKDMTEEELNSKRQSVTVYTKKQVQELVYGRVKMTEDEKNVLVDFKKHWTFTQFVNAIEGNYENNMYFEKVEKTFRKMRIANGYVIDEEKMMLAWLNPETIKTVSNN